MSALKMHEGEADIDLTLVRQLVVTQFPAWADLPLMPVPSGGTVNAIYRLGDDMAVRLPRLAPSSPDLDGDRIWLGRFAPLLPLTIPAPLAIGHPDDDFPFPWSVHRWLEGEDAAHALFTDEHEAATALAGFIAALHGIDTTGWPTPAPRPSGRGVTLTSRDAATRAWIATPPSPFALGEVIAAWEADLAAPEWPGPPVWIHGDLQPLNLLVHRGRLTAVIDFEGFGLGDPATDVMAAWSLFGRDARGTFRAVLGVDDATWTRARAWALSVWVAVLPYYAETNPTFSAIARRAIAEVLADHRDGA